LGEGPHWDAEKQELFLVDIDGHKVVRYVPATDELFSVTLDGRVSPVVPIAGSPNKYIVGVEQELKILEWDGRSTYPTSLTSIERMNEVPTTRFNDGKCDPRGRLVAGTYDTSGGTGGNLYSLNANGDLSKLESGIKISNGLSWSADQRTMYYTDTQTGRVDAFDYDIETGKVQNRRQVFNVWESGHGGSPDGHTIDSDGNLWVCTFGGSKVLNINPRTRSLIRVVDLTGYASQVTSAAFGGQNLDILYVTSAEEGIEPEPSSGSLFAIHDLGVTGMSSGIPYKQEWN